MKLVWLVFNLHEKKKKSLPIVRRASSVVCTLLLQPQNVGQRAHKCLPHIEWLLGFSKRFAYYNETTKKQIEETFS